MSSPSENGAVPPVDTEKSVHIADWEEHNVSNSLSTSSSPSRVPQSLKNRFDAFLPPHKRYFGRLSRKSFLLIIIAMIFISLALIIGLAVGLCVNHNDHHSSATLPSDGQQFQGDMTYYTPGVGACGMTNTEAENVVAISHLLFDPQTPGNPNLNPLCGRMIRATRFDESAGTQRSVDIKVVDRCPVCQTHDLDMSPAAFKELATEAQGRVRVTWAWL